jgi:sugar O-acyltransferase (sialic acid O-acetyltransferase NeuD family)
VLDSELSVMGGGALAREILHAHKGKSGILSSYSDIHLYDDNIEEGKRIDGFLCKGKLSQFISGTAVFGIASPIIKRNLFQKFPHWQQAQWLELIHPKADIQDPNSIKIGQGSIISSGCVLTCGISLGRFVFINLNATVGHDSTIESFVSIMPAVNISGNVYIEEGAYLGTGAIVLPGVRIGKYAVVAAGAVVTKDVPEYSLAMGVPARFSPL